MTVVDPLLKLRARLSTGTPTQNPNADPAATAANLSPQALAVASQLSDRPVSRKLLAGAVRFYDAAFVVVLGFGALWWHAGIEEVGTLVHVTEVLVGALLTVLYIQAFDGYALAALRSFFPPFGRAVAGWTMVFATLLTVTILIGRGQIVGSPWVAAWFSGGVVALGVGRAMLCHLVHRLMSEGRLERRAVIVGGGKAAEDLIRTLEVQPDNDIRICGIFDDRGGDRSPDVVAGYPKLGNIAELVAFGRLTTLDMLIVTVPITAENRILDLLDKLWVLPVDIRLSAHSDRLRFRPRTYSYVGSVPLIAIIDKPLADWNAVAKRSFDLVFGGLLLLVTAPVMLLTALAIRLDSRGPIFFRQKRYGFNNELIEMWKFRSMYVDRLDPAADKLVTRGDPRVTRVGRIIRKTSLDELPQLFNVLAGSISLVGPRPHALAAKADNQLYDKVVDGYYARHRVKPGVTGWAQVNGWRGETDTAEKIQKRVEYDLYYIENWSIWLDFVILMRTPFALFSTRNAY
jgi:Undecaprenyl-phosphate glucose phosphotransferase